MATKKDCFAYNRNSGQCSALKVTQCEFGSCVFYKTKKENCRKCREANGNAVKCNECESNK